MINSCLCCHSTPTPHCPTACLLSWDAENLLKSSITCISGSLLLTPHLWLPSMGKAKSRILSIATRSHLPSLSLCSVWSTHPLVFPSANKLPFKARDKKACGHSCEMATVSLQVSLRRKRSYLERVKLQLLGAAQQDAGDIRGPALSMKFLKELGNFFCCWPCERISSQGVPISLPSYISHLDNCSSFQASAAIRPFIFLSQIPVFQSIFQNGRCLVSLFQGDKILTSEHVVSFLTSSPTSEPTISHHRSYPPAQQNYS